jgi:NAD(P)-dependent dehydrogenase (short-subunit alcohol dehydrogenase family)
MMKDVIVLFGAGSEIAQAYLQRLAQIEPTKNIICVSSQPLNLPKLNLDITHIHTDYSQESLAKVSQKIIELSLELKQVIIFNGLLHYSNMMPEKKLEDITPDYFNTLIHTNSLIPILCVQAILPLLNHKSHCTISALSARVGSISDNNLGGWYSYRASKAALNMMFKTASIEIGRRAKNTKLILFHPGTTDTALSKPFQKNVKPEKLFSSQFVAKQLYKKILHISNNTDSPALSYIDWQGKDISW